MLLSSQLKQKRNEYYKVIPTSYNCLNIFLILIYKVHKISIVSNKNFKWTITLIKFITTIKILIFSLYHSLSLYTCVSRNLYICLFGILVQLLVGLVSSFRYGGDEINAKMAQSEAEILHDTVKYNKANYDEVIRILTTRSKMQLVATFNRYKDLYGGSITKVRTIMNLK